MVNIGLETVGVDVFNATMQGELENFIKDWVIRHQENPEQFPDEMSWDDWAENLSFFLQEKGVVTVW